MGIFVKEMVCGDGRLVYCGAAVHRMQSCWKEKMTTVARDRRMLRLHQKMTGFFPSNLAFFGNATCNGMFRSQQNKQWLEPW